MKQPKTMLKLGKGCSWSVFGGGMRRIRNFRTKTEAMAFATKAAGRARGYGGVEISAECLLKSGLKIATFKCTETRCTKVALVLRRPKSKKRRAASTRRR